MLVLFAGSNDFKQHRNLPLQIITLLLSARRFSSNFSLAIAPQLGDISVGKQILDLIKKYRFNPQNCDVINEVIQCHL